MPDPTVTEKPKPRRRRAKRPAANPTTPKKPRATLKARIAAMGPTHLDAYRVLCDGAEFDVALRDALTAGAELEAAEARRDAADAAVRRADADYRAALDRVNAGKAVLSKLDRVARTIAQERGDLPTDDATAPTVAPASAAD
jgi:hypothetical protein